MPSPSRGRSQSQEVRAAVKKIKALEDDMNGILIDRTEPVHLAVICLIARENMILLGPPGTAKSLLASELCSRVVGANYFQRLLTKFTKESELFISGQGITEETKTENGRRVKITRIHPYHEHMLPCAHIGFLDEVFKGNSAILNSLLSLINERIYYTNEGQAVHSSLLCLFGASNERPALEDGLEALYDRFLVRYYVDYLSGDDFKQLLRLGAAANTPRSSIGLGELETLYRALPDVEISDAIIDSIYHIRERLGEHPTLNMLRPSDRRMKSSLKLLATNALLHGSMSVSRTDIEQVYPYVLWDTSPGVSSNIKVQLLNDLIQELKKGNASIESLFQLEKRCGDLRKEYDALKDEVRRAATDQAARKTKIGIFISRANKITAELETEIGNIKKTDFAQFDEADARIARNILSSLESFKDEIDRQVQDYLQLLRN